MAKSTLPATTRFNKLLNDISNLYLKARKAQVEFAWETGRRIVQEEQNGALRAQYGKGLLLKLSKALTKKHGEGFSESNLRKMRHFYQLHQKQSISTELDWSDYVELLPVKDEKTRKNLERRILSEGLNSVQLRRLVQKVRGGKLGREEPPAKQDLLTPLRGKVYTYRVIRRPVLGPNDEGRELLLDLGFGVFREIEPRAAARFAADQIIESRRKEDNYTLAASERTAKDLFTYNAYIEKVIDADTLKVRIDLGFATWHRQVLRLRDIDAPEVGTKSGDAARAFVQSLLKEAAHVIICSSRSDKYDRYLADVFIPGEEEIFLNNLLLQKSHASKVLR